MASGHNSKTVIVYQDLAGKEPFSEWLNSLGDPITRRRILKRVLRLEQGHFGDFKHVGEGVKELRFFFGAGYRVYFGEDGDTIVILLSGGDKNSQARDIQQAIAFWQEYQAHA